MFNKVFFSCSLYIEDESTKGWVYLKPTTRMSLPQTNYEDESTSNQLRGWVYLKPTTRMSLPQTNYEDESTSNQLPSDGSWFEDAVTDDNISQVVLASRTWCGDHKYFILAVIQLKLMINHQCF